MKIGRKISTSMVIIDSQSVKNTDTAKEKGYDAGKKISGIKRHIAVDTQGFPHAIGISTADITDRNGAIEIIEKYKENLNEIKKVLADGGYTGDNFKTKIKEIINAEVEIVKRNELHTFEVLPKRWIVERCFAWLEKNRRLWKNCERLLNSSLNMMSLAFVSIFLRRL